MFNLLNKISKFIIVKLAGKKKNTTFAKQIY